MRFMEYLRLSKFLPLGLCLGACASGQLEPRLGALEGQNYTAAIEVFGAPDGTADMGDGTSVTSWRRLDAVHVPIWQQTDVAQLLPLYLAVPLTCSIRVYHADGVVTNTQVEGTEGGCAPFEWDLTDAGY